MKAMQIKTAIATLIIGVMAVEYVLADCLKDGGVGCTAQCPSRSTCGLPDNSTLLSAYVTSARGGYTPGTQGNVSLKTFPEQEWCYCTWQYYNQDNSLVTIDCGDFMQVYKTDLNSSTCQF